MSVCPFCSAPATRGNYCGRCGRRFPEVDSPPETSEPTEYGDGQPPRYPGTPPEQYCGSPSIDPGITAGFPSGPTAQAHGGKNSENRIAELHDAVKKNPAAIQAYLDLGQAQLAAEKHEHALSTFRAAKALAPDDVEVYRLGAAIYDALGRRDDAIKALETILRLSDRDVEATIRSARLLFESGRREQSLKRLHSLRDKAEEHPAILLRLAEIELSLGQAEAAQQDLSRYRRLAGDSREMFLLLGQAMLAQAFFDGAIKTYREALAQFPGDVDLGLGLGRAFLGIKDTGQAMLEFERAALAAPRRVEVLLELGKLYGTMSMPEKTEEMFERIRNQYVREGQVFVDMASYYRHQGQDAQAIAHLERARECSPHRQDIIRDLGETLEAQGSYKPAIKEYQTLLEGLPGATWAWHGIIRCANQLGDLEGASKARLSLLTSGQATADLWCDQGEALIKLHRFDEAERAFEEAARLDPSCVRAYQAPDLLETEKIQAEAGECVAKAREALAKKFFNTAMERYEQAITLVPGEPAWSRQLADLCFRTGRRHRAADLLTRLRAHLPHDQELTLRLARLYEFEEKGQLAIELLTTALKEVPDNLPAHIMLLRLKRGQVQSEQFDRELLNALIRNLQHELDHLKGKSPIPRLVEGYAQILFGVGTRFQADALQTGENRFREVFAASPENSWAHQGLALIGRIRGDYHLARKHQEEVVRLSSQPQALHSLARLHENFQHHAEAGKCYSSLRNLFPEEGLYHRRVLEMIAEETDTGGKNGLMERLGLLQQQLRQDPDQPWLHFELAWVQTLIARRAPTSEDWVKRALLSWNKAVALPEASPWHRWGLLEAQLEFLKGSDWQKALNANLKACEKILRDQPDLPYAHFYMGKSLQAFKDLTQDQKALAHFENAFFLDQESADLGAGLAGMYRHLGHNSRVDDMRRNMLLLEPEILLRI